MSEANKELVRRHFEEIFNHKNLAVCDEIVARISLSMQSRLLDDLLLAG